MEHGRYNLLVMANELIRKKLENYIVGGIAISIIPEGRIYRLESNKLNDFFPK